MSLSSTGCWPMKSNCNQRPLRIKRKLFVIWFSILHRLHRRRLFNFCFSLVEERHTLYHVEIWMCCEGRLQTPCCRLKGKKWMYVDWKTTTLPSNFLLAVPPEQGNYGILNSWKEFCPQKYTLKWVSHFVFFFYKVWYPSSEIVVSHKERSLVPYNPRNLLYNIQLEWHNWNCSTSYIFIF